MIINVYENLRVVKKDEYNWCVEQFKEVVKGKEEEKTIVNEWVIFPNFYTSTIKRAITKCVEIIVFEKFDREFKNIDEFLKTQEQILKSIEKNIKSK